MIGARKTSIMNAIIASDRDESLEQINWFEKNQINPNKRNKYPAVNYQETLNFTEIFAKKIADKKRNKSQN